MVFGLGLVLGGSRHVDTCSVLGYIFPSSLSLASLHDYILLDYATVDVFANHCQQQLW